MIFTLLLCFCAETQPTRTLAEILSHPAAASAADGVLVNSVLTSYAPDALRTLKAVASRKQTGCIHCENSGLIALQILTLIQSLDNPLTDAFKQRVAQVHQCEADTACCAASNAIVALFAIRIIQLPLFIQI